MKRFGAILLILSFSLPVFAFENPFKKKPKEPQIPMVQTKEEWLEDATSVKMDLRDLPVNIKEEEKKYIAPKKLPSYFVKYNTSAGSKELDLSGIFKTQNVRSPFVADSFFKNAVYTEAYYYPQTRQIASTFYLIELDNFLSNKEKLEQLSVFNHTRYPLITTALPKFQEGFFSTLTLVDFSKTGKEILVKEKRGSNKYGLYETYVWLYFLGDESKEDSEIYLNNINFENSEFNFVSSEQQNTSGFEANQQFDVQDYKNLPSPPSEMPSLNATGGELKEKEIETVLTNELLPKLKYEDLNDYIKEVWTKTNNGNHPKERWYNLPQKEVSNPSFETNEKTIGYGVRLNLLNETIKAFWFDKQNLILNHIRWDIKPLGFVFGTDEIAVSAFAYGKDGKKISLGNWAVDIHTGIPRLIGQDENIQIEANGVYLKEGLN